MDERFHLTTSRKTHMLPSCIMKILNLITRVVDHRFPLTWLGFPFQPQGWIFLCCVPNRFRNHQICSQQTRNAGQAVRVQPTNLFFFRKYWWVTMPNFTVTSQCHPYKYWKYIFTIITIIILYTTKIIYAKWLVHDIKFLLMKNLNYIIKKSCSLKSLLQCT